MHNINTHVYIECVYFKSTKNWLISLGYFHSTFMCVCVCVRAFDVQAFCVIDTGNQVLHEALAQPDYCLN